MDLLSEEEQWEVLKARLRAYAPAIIAGLAIGVALYFGWSWYEKRKEAAMVDASTQYEALFEAYATGDADKGNKLLEALKRDHPDSIYVTAAHLAQAKVQVGRNELDAAAATLAAVASKGEPELGRIAALRLARVQIEQAKYDDAIATLNRPDVGAYAGAYAHVRGDALLRKGDTAGALREYRAARDEILKTAQDGNGAEVTALLDLKINDLEVPATP